MAPIRNTKAVRDDNNVPGEVNRPQHHQESNDYPFAQLTEQYRVNAWRKTLAMEVKKREALESSLKQIRELSKDYAQRSDILAEMLRRQMEAGENRGEEEEDVHSSCNPSSVLDCDLMCRICRERMANMVLLPCRHLCVCSHCNDLTQACPICDAQTFTSFRVITT